MCTVLCVFVQSHLGQTSQPKLCTKHSSGVIRIIKETPESEKEGAYYKIEGTTAREVGRDNYFRSMQKGNRRILKVVEEIQVMNCKKGEEAAHDTVSKIYQDGGSNWYYVKSEGEKSFVEMIKKAVESTNKGPVKMLFEAMIEMINQDKRAGE